MCVRRQNSELTRTQADCILHTELVDQKKYLLRLKLSSQVNVSWMRSGTDLIPYFPSDPAMTALSIMGTYCFAEAALVEQATNGLRCKPVGIKQFDETEHADGSFVKSNMKTPLCN